MKCRKDFSQDEIKYLRLACPEGIPIGKFNYDDLAKEFETSRNMILKIIKYKVFKETLLSDEDKTYSGIMAIQDKINDEYYKRQKETL